MEQIALIAAVAAAVVMFALGLELKGRDFALLVRRPKALTVGLANQLILLPGLALLVCVAVPPAVSPALVVGFMVVAALPGAAPSNLMTRLAGGNTALSVSLTGITSVLSFLTLPAAIALAHAVTGAAPPGGRSLAGVAGRIVLACGLPLFLGMVVGRARPGLAARLGAIVRPLTLVALVGVIAATLWVERERVGQSLAVVGWRALGLNLLTIAAGFSVAQLAGLGRPARTAICLECGLHNCALGVYVCVNLLGGGDVVLPTLAYGLIMWVTAPAIVWLARRTTSATASAPLAPPARA